MNRDAAYVLERLKIVKDQVYTTTACQIQIPARFSECGLAKLGAESYIAGIYVCMMDGRYAVSNVPVMVPIKAHRFTLANHRGTAHYVFYYEPGDVVLPTLKVVKRELMIYDILKELVINGNVPWYMSYDDLGQLFDRALEYAASHVGSVPETIELLISMITRRSTDLTQYYRLHPDGHPKFIPLSSVYYAATNTLNKVAGNYFSEGVNSALVTETTDIERIEALLRT